MMKHHTKKYRIFILFLIIATVCLPTYGCADSKEKTYEISKIQGSRDNTPECLVPDAPGERIFSDDSYLIDYSNADKGYIMAVYTGTSKKTKLQITLPDSTVYTYNLTSDMECFPLSSDSGTYQVGVFENISSNQYSTVMVEAFDVSISMPYGAYLYPNQYVNFSKDDDTISLGAEISYSANEDLDVVSNVYNYIITHITYDYKKAETVESGYLPDIDDTISTGKGICLDYAAVMASILRSQGIPTHLEVGYAGTAYHAWISTFIKDKGWVNGIIQFDGTDWELMDPTFASTTGEKKLEKFIGKGDNYVVKYIY